MTSDKLRFVVGIKFPLHRIIVYSFRLVSSSGQGEWVHTCMWTRLEAALSRDHHLLLFSFYFKVA